MDYKEQLPKSLLDKKPPKKWISAGGVVLTDGFERLYLREPSNNYGPISFAKGKIDKGETKEQAALREVREEIGIIAKILPSSYLGTGEGGYSVTHYFVMEAQRDLGKHDRETKRVLIVPWTEAFQIFARDGNTRDLEILQRAFRFIEKYQGRER